MNFLRRITLLSLAIAGAASFAAAQSSTGSIKGVLTDDSGASIPAAFITAQNTAGKQQAQSQADGSYTFQGLQPGRLYAVAWRIPDSAPFSKVITVNAPAATVTLPIQLAVSGGEAGNHGEGRTPARPSAWNPITTSARW